MPRHHPFLPCAQHAPASRNFSSRGEVRSVRQGKIVGWGGQRVKEKGRVGLGGGEDVGWGGMQGARYRQQGS